MNEQNNTCQACHRMVEPGQKAIVIQYGTLGISGYVEQVTMRDLFHRECPVAVMQEVA